MKNFSILYFLPIVLFFLSCSKEGTGGKASVSGTVKHHEKTIPYSTVYIKYDAQEFAGKNTSVYDDSRLTGSNGHYEFSSLKKGDYALYAVGYDSTMGHAVSGGVPVKLKRTEKRNLDVPVRED
jgi:hypothetical protein